MGKLKIWPQISYPCSWECIRRKSSGAT